MNCPHCGLDTRVIDTRADERNQIKRKRTCRNGHVFITHEMVTEDMPVRDRPDWPKLRHFIVEAAKQGLRPALIHHETGIPYTVIRQEINKARNEGIKIPKFKRGNIVGITYSKDQAA